MSNKRLNDEQERFKAKVKRVFKKISNIPKVDFHDELEKFHDDSIL